MKSGIYADPASILLYFSLNVKYDLQNMDEVTRVVG